MLQTPGVHRVLLENALSSSVTVCNRNLPKAALVISMVFSKPGSTLLSLPNWSNYQPNSNCSTLIATVVRRWSYKHLVVMLQSQRQMPAEWVIDESLFTLKTHEDDITLCFCVLRVLQLYSVL